MDSDMSMALDSLSLDNPQESDESARVWTKRDFDISYVLRPIIEELEAKNAGLNAENARMKKEIGYLHAKLDRSEAKEEKIREGMKAILMKFIEKNGISPEKKKKLFEGVAQIFGRPGTMKKWQRRTKKAEIPPNRDSRTWSAE